VPRRPSTARRLRSAVALLSGGFALAACAGVPPTSAVRTIAACGSASTATIAAVDATVARNIYRNELAGREVSFDLAQITGAHDLLAAVTARDPAATLRAVQRIVYHPAWHIVRLRVLDTSGRVLADVGGPYVIAPVPGVLRSGGHVVASFVMSVQDDAGETKLETRFLGDPIGIYVSGRLVAERYGNLPSRPPRGTTSTVGGVSYRAVSETENAFPSGTLTEVILVAPAPAAAATRSCAAVRAGEFGRVAERFAELAVSLPQHYPGYATTVSIYTGAMVFVRAGARQLASTGGSGPASLPVRGTIEAGGRKRLVFSFEPAPSTRVYLLVPPG
jgi:hypothetical protein